MCLDFLVSHTSGVAPIIWISNILRLLRLSIVSYLGLGLVLGKKLILDLGAGSLSIFFIVEYQFI